MILAYQILKPAFQLLTGIHNEKAFDLFRIQITVSHLNADFFQMMLRGKYIAIALCLGKMVPGPAPQSEPDPGTTPLISSIAVAPFPKEDPSAVLLQTKYSIDFLFHISKGPPAPVVRSHSSLYFSVDPAAFLHGFRSAPFPAAIVYITATQDKFYQITDGYPLLLLVHFFFFHTASPLRSLCSRRQRLSLLSIIPFLRFHRFLRHCQAEQGQMASAQQRGRRTSGNISVSCL